MENLPKFAWGTVYTLPISFPAFAHFAGFDASELPALAVAFLFAGGFTVFLLLAHRRKTPRHRAY